MQEILVRNDKWDRDDFKSIWKGGTDTVKGQMAESEKMFASYNLTRCRK